MEEDKNLPPVSINIEYLVSLRLGRKLTKEELEFVRKNKAKGVSWIVEELKTPKPPTTPKHGS